MCGKEVSDKKIEDEKQSDANRETKHPQLNSTQQNEIPT